MNFRDPLFISLIFQKLLGATSGVQWNLGCFNGGIYDFATGCSKVNDIN